MFEIRDSQFEAIEVQSLNLFAIRVGNFLQENFPQAKEQDRELLTAEIEPILRKSQSFGMVTEQELVIFVLAAVYLGEDFDQALPEVAEILSNDTLHPAEKANQLEEFTIAVLEQLNAPAGEK